MVLPFSSVQLSLAAVPKGWQQFPAMRSVLPRVPSYSGSCLWSLEPLRGPGTGLYCSLLACHPWAAPSRASMETPWRQRGCFSPSVSEQKHQAQFTSSSLHRAPQSPPEFTVSGDGSTRRVAGPEASPTVLHVQLNQDF